jgi:hypothetical protein
MPELRTTKMILELLQKDKKLKIKHMRTIINFFYFFRIFR